MLTRKIQQFVVVMALQVFLIAIAKAHPGAEADEDASALFHGMGAVVSATRLPQPLLHSPVSSTILDRETIQHSGFTHVADLFRLVPGFQVGMASGSHYVVTYHGQELSFPTRIEVLVDGRSVYDNLLSSVKWNSIGVELEDIEQIEIIRGPNAPVFGSNALVATINIQTRAPFEEQGTWLNLVSGTQDSRRMQFRYADIIGALDYSISLGYREDTGFGELSNRGEEMDSTQLQNFSFRGHLMPSSDTQIDVQLGYNGGQPGTHLQSDVDLFKGHSGRLNSHYQMLRLTRQHKYRETFWQLTHNHLNQTDRFDLGTVSDLTGIPAENIPALGFTNQALSFRYADGTSDRLDFEFQSLENPTRHGRLVWGGGVRLDRLKTDHIFPHAKKRNLSARVFSNSEWNIGASSAINLGAMLEVNELVDAFGSARLAYNYYLSPLSSLRLSASHTQRSPSILDEYFDVAVRSDDGRPISQVQTSQGEIEEEQLDAFEIGYTTVLDNGGLLFDIKLFYEEGRNLISGATDPSVFEYAEHDGAEVIANEDSYQIAGIEGQLKITPNPGEFFCWQYSLTDSERKRLQKVPDHYASAAKIMTPEATMSLLYSKELPNGYSAGFGYYYMTTMKWLGDGGVQQEHGRLDLRLAKSFVYNNADIDLELVAQNVGDSYHEYHQENNRFETRYFAKAKIKYN